MPAPHKILLDSTGKPICSSAGTFICVPCRPVPPCSCRPLLVAMSIDAYPFSLGGHAAAFDLNKPYVYYPDFGSLGWFSNPDNVGDPLDLFHSSYYPFKICGQGTVGGKNVCYSFELPVAAYCRNDGKIALYTIRPRGSVGFTSDDHIWLTFSFACTEPTEAVLLAVLDGCGEPFPWHGPYAFSFAMQFTDPTTSTTYNFTLAGKIWTTEDQSSTGPLPGSVYCNQQLKDVYGCSPQSTAQLGVIGCVNNAVYPYDPVDGVWWPACDGSLIGGGPIVIICCDGLGNCGSAYCVEVPPPPCCPFNLQLLIVATITGIPAGFPFEPGCDTCVGTPTLLFFSSTAGPGGLPGYIGFFAVDPSCATGEFVNYTHIRLQVYCIDGFEWAVVANFISSIPTEPDIFIEADLPVPPCSVAGAPNYFEVALNMNPGTNCALGCPCFGGAYVIAGA